MLPEIATAVQLGKDNSTSAVVIFVDGKDFSLFEGRFDETGAISGCQLLAQLGSSAVKDLSFSRSSAGDQVFWINTTEQSVWSLSLNQSKPVRIQSLWKSGQLVKSLTPVCLTCQHITEAERECLVPSIGGVWMELVSAQENSLTLSVPSPQAPPGCNQVVLPPTTYSVMYFKDDKAGHWSRSLEAFPESCLDTLEDCRYLANFAVHDPSTTSLQLELKGLKHFTTYAVLLKASSVFGASQVVRVDVFSKCEKQLVRE